MKTTKLANLFFIFIFSSILCLGGNADFTYNNHCINNLIYFEDLSETQDEIVSWYWNFGDGGIATDNSPVHAFAESGNYEVSLTIKTIVGKEYTLRKSIEINAAPFAFFNPKTKCDQIVNFNDHSFTRSNDVKMWIWDFGDGNYSTEQNPNHRFDEAKKTDVHFKVLDKNGCWDSITQSVNVIENPKTGFDINNVILSNPAIIRINSHNKTDSVFYLINDEIVSNSNFLTVPTNEAVEIKQKTLNDKGCIDSTSKNISLKSEFHLPLPSMFSPSKGELEYGVNDQNIKVNSFEIFDSSGQPVFQTKSNIKWNGFRQNGSPAQKGVYIYSLDYENLEGTKILQKGKFILE